MERKYKAEIFEIAELPPELRETYYPDDQKTALVISHDGQVIADYCDRGEPEDNSFYRDWSWVARELRSAYELGLQDGRQV